ncbi:calcium-binding protein [Nocardioides rubriscoriae]|uniref:calcium-binding protein n=1 Tax=Nocardioides rubriscoriae TaxID=642762 RepID=UPI0011DF15D0|nr:calcium-binding protein [Nocardioides rubriscoriae]
MRNLGYPLFTAVLVVPAVISEAAPTQAGAAATCGGQPATIVGNPGQARLSGTPEPDVIISNGAKLVYADEGADLVCLTGGDATAVLDGYEEYDHNFAWAVDRVIGSDGNDLIVSGAGADDGMDIDQRTENGDLVSMGTGHSTLTMDGVPVGVIQGGPGRDRLILRSSGNLMSADAGASVAVDEHPAATLNGIESFHLEGTNLNQIRFRGTPAAESLYANAGEAPLIGDDPDTLTATLGGGNDVVSVAAGTNGSVAGGEGADEVRYTPTFRGSRNVVVSLRNGSVDATQLAVTATSFTNVTARSISVTVNGDTQSNVIRAMGCTVRVSGGSGNDRITARSTSDCTRKPHVVRGGPGKDTLVGSGGRDNIYGGPGRDIANGGPRLDLCLAEVRRNCER